MFSLFYRLLNAFISDQIRQCKHQSTSQFQGCRKVSEILLYPFYVTFHIVVLLYYYIKLCDVSQNTYIISSVVLTFLILPFWYLLTLVVPDIFQKSSKTVVCVCYIFSGNKFVIQIYMSDSVFLFICIQLVHCYGFAEEMQRRQEFYSRHSEHGTQFHCFLRHGVQL